MELIAVIVVIFIIYLAIEYWVWTLIILGGFIALVLIFTDDEQKKKKKEDEQLSFDTVNQKPSKNIKRILYSKQEGRCIGCNVFFLLENFELDHIVPKNKGGPNIDDNLQLLCSRCNRIKGNRSQEYLKEALEKEESA